MTHVPSSVHGQGSPAAQAMLRPVRGPHGLLTRPSRRGGVRHRRCSVGSRDVGVDLVTAVLPPDVVLDSGDPPSSVLTAAEQSRAAALRDPRDREAFLAAHLLARRCVTDLTRDPNITIAQECPECGGHDHGKPSVAGHPEVSVSWSHTRGHVGAAASYGLVGIDVEAAVARERDVVALARRAAAHPRVARPSRGVPPHVGRQGGVGQGRRAVPRALPSRRRRAGDLRRLRPHRHRTGRRGRGTSPPAAAALAN